MGSEVGPPGAPPRLLRIGEAATLTGVSPGRIRHYQGLGLLQPTRSQSGYRYFGTIELLRLLQIDLLRSLGVSLTEIGTSLPGRLDGGALTGTLERHRATLQAERQRLDRLLAALDAALESEATSPETVTALLASANSTPQDSLGIFGRLSKPLSVETSRVYEQVLGGGWGLPVPSIFGRMLLPAAVTDLLEQLARADGYQELFRRIRVLALEILSLSSATPGRPSGARILARDWLRTHAAEPLPAPVQAALDRTLPRIRERDVLNQGFQLWAESISPPAAEVLRSLESEARTRGLVVLGVLLARPAHHRPSSTGRATHPK
ncbi:MAG TPA: MerR family transcriptional regulator [Candidatus Dormibacteraeota bacterium]|nr:MerR family transcriptional regulator [Candidatus Dormibacteraeota bacterium]